MTELIVWDWVRAINMSVLSIAASCTRKTHHSEKWRHQSLDFFLRGWQKIFTTQTQNMCGCDSCKKKGRPPHSYMQNLVLIWEGSVLDHPGWPVYDTSFSPWVCLSLSWIRSLLKGMCFFFFYCLWFLDLLLCALQKQPGNRICFLANIKGFRVSIQWKTFKNTQSKECECIFIRGNELLNIN